MDDQGTNREGRAGVNDIEIDFNKWFFRYSLKTLLVIMTVVAAFLIGYTLGYDAGKMDLIKSNFPTP